MARIKAAIKKTLALEAVVDYNLYFWHCSFGYAGSLNDLNVLDASTLINKLNDLDGVEGSFRIWDEDFKKSIILVDGIYPSWARFVKTYQFPIMEEHKSKSLFIIIFFNSNPC